MTRKLIRTFALSLVAGAAFACGEYGPNWVDEKTQEATGETLRAAIEITTDWGSGYCANVNITNLGTASASTWTVVLELNQAALYTSWNGTVSGSASRKTVTPVGWNAVISPGKVQSFGYCANTTGNNKTPQIVSPLGEVGTGSGGASSGGSASAGGSASGGATSGGATSGGATSGGATSGGASSGGATSGGATSGGATSGGASSGGATSGGASSGGATSGGATSGGATSGGATSGGATSGGASSGGATSGGSSSGGAGSGGRTGYSPTSSTLLDPDRAVGVVRSLADFRARARDNSKGGFFTFVNVDGSVTNDRRKGFVTTTRDAWTFSRAYMLTGDEKYLEHARHALAFLYAKGWDAARGGWYFTADESGNLTPYSQYWDPNTWKWSFVQHYALLGIGAYCDVTRDATHCDWLTRGRTLLDTKMWDSGSNRLGYYEQANLDMSNPRDKGFTATADALTTHALQLDLIYSGTYRQRLLELGNIVVDRLAANMDLSIAKFGFPELYNSNWQVTTSNTSNDVGHVLKSAWVLARVYLRHPDVRYRTAARKFIYEVLNNGGWDEAAGVPYTIANWSTGAQTKLAECWQVEQAIMSGLVNWYITESSSDADTYLKMADRALLFFERYILDNVNGGTWKMNNLNGSRVDNTKGTFFNVEYHSTETFFFTYLYGNLLLRHEPVTLYYQIAPSQTARTIELNPFEAGEEIAEIWSVTLNGEPLAGANGGRSIVLGPGQGGKLQVEFGPVD